MGVCCCRFSFQTYFDKGGQRHSEAIGPWCGRRCESRSDYEEVCQRYEGHRPQRLDRFLQCSAPYDLETQAFPHLFKDHAQKNLAMARARVALSFLKTATHMEGWRIGMDCGCMCTCTFVLTCKCFDQLAILVQATMR